MCPSDFLVSAGRRAFVSLALTVAVLASSAGLWAATPNVLFSDGAVLQQGRPVPVWGTGDDGEEVTISIQDKSATATTADGRWMAWLPPLEAGGPFELTIKGNNETKVGDVLVGEVWIASGQSNMQWPLNRTVDSEATIAAANNPQLRLFSVPLKYSDKPETTVDAKWQLCTPETVPGFSAVGYFFGQHLQERLGVPVGVINTSYGGTPAENWTSREKLASVPETRHYVGEGGSDKASGLYNAMIAPLVPYAIEGAIWYQGESNAGRAWEYYTLFPAMIEDWRDKWGQGSFPFLFVQLAPFKAITQEPTESDWAELRDAQRNTTLVVPQTAEAVITDVGDENDIHPQNKKPVGDRLALAARALAYGENLVYSGPDYAAIDVAGDTATIHFDHVGTGLAIRDNDGNPQETLSGFTICGPDRVFHNAEAQLSGNTVTVRCDAVTHPVAVRYGWANYPLGNLWNADGLPASPFRTDDFP
ncbi:MAG: sialate O-acetylesterase [Pirellulales bacterium]